MAKRSKASQAGASGQKPDPANLTQDQQRFARYYVRDNNATQAYLKAYPDVTYGTAKTEGCKLLTKPDLLEFIEYLREKDRRQLDIKREDVLRVFAKVMRKSYTKDKDRMEAACELWDKLGLGEEARKGNWFDGIERIAELIQSTKGTK